MTSNIALALALLLSAALSTPAWASDIAAGKLKAEQTCQTCHGMDGVGSMPMVANLSGQQKLYIIAQLKAYKSGKHQHEQMSIIAGMLSDEDIENVAAWYSAIKVTIDLVSSLPLTLAVICSFSEDNPCAGKITTYT
ncbi:MAG: cytochrome c [Rhodospirillales bacterium]|nr:cytochrome c [Rhodospirillales bacterium]